MGFSYSNKLFGGTGSGGVSIGGTGSLTAGRVVLADSATSLVDDGGLTYNRTTDTLAVALGTVTASNITATGLATPGAITVTPTLTKFTTITVVGAAAKATGLLTVPAAASLSDTETFSINDGSSQQGFEFDTNGAVVNPGFIAVDLTGLVTAEDVAAACTAAIIGATGPGWTVTAVDNLDGTVTLQNTVYGAAGNSNNAEAVADAGFILTNMTGGADGVLDGDYFTLDDGTAAVVYEFDSDATVTAGRVAVPIVGTENAQAVRDLVIIAINSSTLAATAIAAAADTLTVSLDTPGAAGGANSENVVDAGVLVPAWGNPTAATTYTYKLVARLADGTTTEAGAASSTAAGHATLSATNYNALSWSAVSGAASYDVYKTVGGTTGEIASATTALSLNDTGLAGGGETAPTVNGTGVVTGFAGLRIQSVGVPATAALAAADVSGTLLSNYGQGGANTTTLPAAAAGLNFIAIVGTAGAGAWHIKAGASDKLYLDGVALDDGDKASLAAPAVGNTLTCVAFRTGASAWDWICTSGGGATWTDGGA